MAFNLRAVTAAVLLTGVALAPAAQAHEWHHGGWHGHRGYYRHGGGNVGAAIGAGILGFALGAAVGSSAGPYYAPPPPVYYGY